MVGRPQRGGAGELFLVVRTILSAYQGAGRGMVHGDLERLFDDWEGGERRALAEHPERPLIDFGIGENDEPADPAVRRVMAEEIGKPVRGLTVKALSALAAKSMRMNCGASMLSAVTRLQPSPGMHSRISVEAQMSGWAPSKGAAETGSVRHPDARIRTFNIFFFMTVSLSAYLTE